MDNMESIKLKDAMNFYMLANNLKYITDDGFQSIWCNDFSNSNKF